MYLVLLPVRELIRSYETDILSIILSFITVTMSLLLFQATPPTVCHFGVRHLMQTSGPPSFPLVPAKSCTASRLSKLISVLNWRSNSLPNNHCQANNHFPPISSSPTTLSPFHILLRLPTTVSMCRHPRPLQPNCVVLSLPHLHRFVASGYFLNITVIGCVWPKASSLAPAPFPMSHSLQANSPYLLLLGFTSNNMCTLLRLDSSVYYF